MTSPLHHRRLRFTSLLTGLLVVVGVCRSAAAQAPVTNGRPPAADTAPAAASAPQEPVGKDDDGAGGGDLAKKIDIMNSPRWRRAIFELGEWLSAQSIYTPTQVRNIKADFNRKVETMSSHDLEYLLDDLDAKFQILDTPEARDARSWVAQYLSVMSDQKRAEALKDVPNVVTMSAAQLQQEIQKIEQKRGSLQQQQAAFDESRQQLVQQAQAARQQTAAASAAAMRNTGGVSYSPYRSGGGGGGGGKPPFSDVHGSGMTITSGPFGAYVSMNVGGF
jgi:pyruvate/2-oxoglutarate dehydrogenase complex dihydrolipoamide acyltransferase (E2) component